MVTSLGFHYLILQPQMYNGGQRHRDHPHLRPWYHHGGGPTERLWMKVLHFLQAYFVPPSALSWPHFFDLSLLLSLTVVVAVTSLEAVEAVVTSAAASVLVARCHFDFLLLQHCCPPSSCFQSVAKRSFSLH